MWTYNYNLELYHHGILGQRWGRRNGPPYPLSSGAHSWRERLHLRKYGIKLDGDKSKSKKSKAAKTSSSNNLKKIDEMSYEELKKEVERLSLEKRYRDLISESSNNKKKTNKVLASITKVAAKPLTEVTQEAMKIGLKKMINSAATSSGKNKIFN